MRHTIDSDIVERHNLTIDEFILLLFFTGGGDTQKCVDSLRKKGFIDNNIIDKDKVVLPLATKQLVQDILLNSNDKVMNKQRNFNDLANKLREIFPKGYKEGTNYSWRGSTAEISRKLKNLVVKYDCNFTDEEAIEATKAYVASFNGNYRYMKLLKYFLLKTPINNNGDVEIESDFMTFLENKEALQQGYDKNWVVELL